MSRILTNTTSLYRDPEPAIVANLIASCGIAAALERWSESQTEDSLRKLAAIHAARERAEIAAFVAEHGLEAAAKRWEAKYTLESLRKIADAHAAREAAAADDIVETTKRLGEIKAAAQALGVSQTHIRDVFARAGERLPLLTVQERVRRAFAAKKAKRSAAVAAARQR